MADFILVDTSVLSEARRSEPDEDVIFFLDQIPPGSIAVPPTAIFELERGALNLFKTNPLKSAKLAKWLDDLLKTDVWVPPVNSDVKRLLARMAMVPELARFWRSHGEAPKLEFGCDPEIAATAIVHGMPIATQDVGDYLKISRQFPLPGLYCPRDGIWHVMPDDNWRIPEELTSIGLEWRRMIGPVA
ncbi:PIN domain-containing protein [Sinorhizobium terangae]|uniref:PIN domain-containing protein n=1 Tax=Sinorhizobium terangae TaxID=110322 RepID=UPI0024B25AEE|nr:PIN domain-containing protein [Sinorhizobium terangae]WFU49171.1 hypothetical protein QA637_07170 [Sinorhizobium terangae]